MEPTNRTVVTSNNSSNNSSDNSSNSFVPISQMSYPEKTDILFGLLTSLNWCDKDSGTRCIRDLRNIDTTKLNQLMPTMFKLADELYTAVHSNTGALDDMEDIDKYNFLFHVIAKGQQFYFSCIVDPEFCTYILPDQYQSLCNFIMTKLKYRSIDDMRS